MDDALRVNYAKLWISLITPNSEKVDLDRRKYAYLVGNIDDTLYPIFQAAITGRAALDDPYGSRGQGVKGSVMEFAENTPEEMKRMRHTIVAQEGLMQSVFDLLRRVPRRMLMVLKVKCVALVFRIHSPIRTDSAAFAVTWLAPSTPRFTRLTDHLASSSSWLTIVRPVHNKPYRAV